MLRTSAILSSLFLATGCGMEPTPEDSLDPDSQEPAGDDQAEEDVATTGGTKLQVMLTDAPADYDEVWVTIDSVEIETEDGWLMLTDESQSYDLLTLQNDVTTALGGAELEPGYYGQLRLIVGDAFLVVDGHSEELFIASGAQTGIKINIDSTFEDGMQYGIVLDFDAHKSVKHTGTGWLMTPVIQVEELSATPLEPTTEGETADSDSTTTDPATEDTTTDPATEDTTTDPATEDTTTNNNDDVVL